MRALLILSLLGCLTGCAVYMPMQGAAPDIHDKNQAELRASTFLSRWEASGAYSPLKHVLVRGALGRRSDTDDSIYWRGRQYEVAAGAYWPLGQQWLVGGMGGFGQARSQSRYRNDGQIISLGPSTQHEFDMRFNKLFGEAYVLLQTGSRVSLGATCRATRLQFTTLTDVGQPIVLRQLTRAEPMLLMRVGFGGMSVAEQPVQLQLSCGYSVAMGYDERQPDPDDSSRQLRRTRSYVAVGIGILPHRLLRLNH